MYGAIMGSGLVLRASTFNAERAAKRRCFLPRCTPNIPIAIPRVAKWQENILPGLSAYLRICSLMAA